MAVKTLSVADAISQIGVKVLVYGPTGSGKTSIAKTMPKPVLVLDFEGGILSLLNTEGILVCPIKSTEDLLNAVKELQSDIQFRSVVFDGLSIFVKRRVQELRGAKERVTWDEWQKLTNEVRAAVLPLLQLRKHLLLTCLPRWIREKDERGRDVGPIIGATIDLTPALRNDLVAACDFVGYLVGPNDPLFPNETERKVIFQLTDSVQLTVKSRFHQLSVTAPDFAAWLRALSISETVERSVPFAVTVVGAEKAELTTQEIRSEENQPVSLEPEETTQEVSQDVSQEASEDLTRRIFRVARELGIDNKALGRLARTYFGTSFVRDLSDDQKTRLLAHLEQRLAAKRQEDKKQPTQDDGAVIEFLTSWRQVRGSDESFDFEAELAEIAVKNNWLPDELEAAVSEKLLDRSFDFSQLPDDRYWLAAVPKELLGEIVAELRGEQS
jgi:predicted Fe-S protein YdhL (DUF1289 family)